MKVYLVLFILLFTTLSAHSSIHDHLVCELTHDRDLKVELYPYQSVDMGKRVAQYQGRDQFGIWTNINGHYIFYLAGRLQLQFLSEEKQALKSLSGRVLGEFYIADVLQTATGRLLGVAYCLEFSDQ